MAILERRIKLMHHGKAEEVLAWEKKWDAIEERIGGYSPKRYMTSISGSLPWNAWVWEREWESFAAAEETYQRGQQAAGDEMQALAAQWDDLFVSSETIEFYQVR